MTETPTQAEPGGSDVEQPDSVVGFGVAEIAFLIRDFAGEQRQRALDLLRLNPDYATEEIGVAGASSLVAHNYAVAEADNEIRLTGPAELLAYVLGEATRWTTLTFFDGDRSDIAMHVQAPRSAAILQPRGLGTWWAMFRLPEGSDAELLKLMVDTYARPEPTNAVAFQTITEQGGSNLFVRKTEAGGWVVAWVKGEGIPPVEENTDDAGVVTALERLTTEDLTASDR